jgi:hypothetical protein
VRQLVALLGLVWAALNLGTAYLLASSGWADKTVAKGFMQQLLVWGGGALIALFALALAWRCLALAVSRDRGG